MNKNDLRVVKTKKIIFNALLLLLKDKPISKIKVTELCKAAQINRGTFYFHYEDVEDVLLELFEQIVQDLEKSYSEPFKKGFDILEQNLEVDMIKIFHHVKEYEDFYRIVFSEDTSMKYYYRIYDVICNLNKQSKFGINKNDPFTISYAANAIMGLLIRWYQNDFKESVDEMNERLIDMLKTKQMVLK